MFCNVSRPLNGNPIAENVGNNALKKLEFWNLPVINDPICLPSLSTGQDDCVLVLVKLHQSGVNFHTGLLSNLRSLCKVAKVGKCSKCNKKVSWNRSSDYWNNVTLHVMVLASSDLLQL